uniref:Uncharacterized protein n=1 Tax=Anguilla anguilla TaxID=7936 RepID=A0A0E9P5H3_ANGAN
MPRHIGRVLWWLMMAQNLPKTFNVVFSIVTHQYATGFQWGGACYSLTNTYVQRQKFYWTTGA